MTALGALTATLAQDTTNGANGLVIWNYNIDPLVLSELAPGSTQNEVFNVIVNDGHGGTVTQQVTVTLNGPEGARVNAAPEITSKMRHAGNGANTTVSGIVLHGLRMPIRRQFTVHAVANLARSTGNTGCNGTR